MWIFALLACPAAQLGIELPPEGMEAISPEDLRRDTELVLREGPAGWQSRMEAMNATREPGERVCMRQGEGEAAPAWTSVGPTVPDAVNAAVLISLAKAWDTLGEKPGPRVYCLGDGPGDRIPLSAPDARKVTDVDFRVLATTLRKRAI